MSRNHRATGISRSRSSSGGVKRRVKKPNYPFWPKVFRLANIVYGSRKEKWVIAVNGQFADPRRFRNWQELDASIREDIKLDVLPADGSVACVRTSTKDRSVSKPTYWQCLWWAWKRELRIWRTISN